MSTRGHQTSNLGASGNNSRANRAKYERDRGTTVIGTGIAFVNPGTITDSGNQLALFTVGSSFFVRGSPANSRQFQVVTSAAGTLTVTPAVVTAEIAGPSITLARED
ncbi:MAG: hypothetical protein ACKVQR_04445 [Aquabacterium sp.]